MQVRKSLFNLTFKALVESFKVESMEKVASMLLRDYDLHKRTGYPGSISVPKRDAARQIIKDIEKAGRFPDLVIKLIDIHTNGYMGRNYTIHYLKNILNDIQEQGLIFDPEYKIFMEDPAARRTRNWGALRQGEEYIITFLRLDIVGSSQLVRKYSPDIIDRTYSELRKIVQDAIDRRNGRIWNWEGDGGLVAFCFSKKNMQATLSAVNILHELFIFNQTVCELEKPLRLRIAIHSGPYEYSSSEEDLNKSETVKKAVLIENKYTQPNTVTVSNMVSIALDKLLLQQFKPIDVDIRTKYYNYSLEWER